MPRVTATYESQATFTLPANVKLIEDDSFADGVIGAWYVKWNILHYIDADGKEQKVECDQQMEQGYKRPYDTELDNNIHAEVADEAK